MACKISIHRKMRAQRQKIWQEVLLHILEDTTTMQALIRSIKASQKEGGGGTKLCLEHKLFWGFLLLSFLMKIEIEIQELFGEIIAICKIIANSISKINMTQLEMESK